MAILVDVDRETKLPKTTPSDLSASLDGRMAYRLPKEKESELAYWGDRLDGRLRYSV